MEKQKIPTRVVPRLSRYYRILREFDDKAWVSSKELSVETGFTDTQIRRDFTYFGHFGNRGKGYNVEELKKSLKKILGLDKSWNVMLVDRRSWGEGEVEKSGEGEGGEEL
jgi:redox-sensing transcriptional repressor